MAGLDPNQYVNMINFSATHVLRRHMDPPSFEATWAKFVLSANKWLRQQGRKEYDKVDLAKMRGEPDGATEKILTDLGHKGCLVADLIGILEDAEMHDILRSEEFKLRTDQETPSNAGFTEADCSSLYQNAIGDNNPTITLHISKAMTIGPPQVGKSTVRRRLLGLPLPEVSSSTPVMETADTVSLRSSVRTRSLGEAGPSSDTVPSDEHTTNVEVETSSDDSEGDDDDLGLSVAKRCKYESRTYMADGNEWVMLNEASVIHSLLTHLQEKIGVAARLTESQKSLEGRRFSEAPTQPSGALLVGYNPSSVTEVSRRMYRKLQNPERANVALPDAHLLQFLDCGGQLAYHDILPIFVNIPAIYLHVFNVAKELTECPIDELRLSRGEKKYSAESALSVAEMITRSVMTVHLLADKKVHLPSELKHDNKSPKPHIVLVGTHLDELDEKDLDPKVKAVNGVLRKAMYSKSHDLEGMLMKNPKRNLLFFPVSKKSHKKCSSKHLKRRIRDQANDNAVKVKVPVRWYLRQMLEISQGEKPLYTYSELYHRCKGEGSITDLGEFHVMVTYFHALGLLVHLCEADVRHTEGSDCLVFTNPSYLYENISKIYQVQFEEEVEGLGKIKLKYEGKLTEEVLQELNIQLDHDHFMDLLVQLYIGAEIKPHETMREESEQLKGEERKMEGRKERKTMKRTLFVPSVLVNPSPDSTGGAASWKHDAGAHKYSVSFALTFKHTSFVPCGVFTGMIARLQSAPGWDVCTLSISRICMNFAVGALGTVNVLDCATHVSVEIDWHDGLRPEQYQEYRDTIITATADSFCFLFHSKADKDPQSGPCIACLDKPYLVIGQTCHLCPPQSGVTHKVPHFAELKVENNIPVTVRCLETMKPKLLGDSALERVPFQNILHYAVVEEQRTGHTQKGAVSVKVPVPSETGSITGFAVVTANPTEEKAVRHFLQLGGSSGEVWEGASECIWKNDPYLKSNGITVTYKGVVEGCNYELFTLTREGESERVFGVHIKCLQQAAFTEEGAQDTAAALLMHAKEWKWQLTDVFSVGCCGYADDSKCEENLMGYVLLANQFEAYLNRGKMAGGDLQHHPEVYHGDRQWVSDLQDHRITKPMRQSGADAGKLKNIPVKEVPRIESGPLVVKSDEYAQQLCGASYRSGIEMEAIGFIKALRFYEKQGNQIVPNFVSVKGVSDFGKGKSSKAETTFFGQKTAALSDGERQQVATLHSIALVIRGVVERYLVPRPVVNPEDLLST